MIRSRPAVALWTAFFALTLAPAADAGVWDRLLRGAAKTADDVPLSAADDVAARLAKNDDLRDAALRRLGRTADDAADLRRLRGLLDGADPALVRSLDDLAPAERQAAIVLAEGGASLTRTVPDVGLRGGLLRRGGADLAAGLGVAGDDAARAAVKLDAGLRGGTVVVPSGVRAVTLEDFGTFLTGGPNRWKFWDEAVRPHWKQWAAGGAMAALLAAPDAWGRRTGEPHGGRRPPPDPVRRRTPRRHDSRRRRGDAGCRRRHHRGRRGRRQRGGRRRDGGVRADPRGRRRGLGPAPRRCGAGPPIFITSPAEFLE